MAKVAFIYTEYVDDNPKYGELLIRVFRNNKYDATLCSPQQQVTFETIQKMQPDLLFFEIALNSNEAGRKLLDSCTMDESLNRMPTSSRRTATSPLLSLLTSTAKTSASSLDQSTLPILALP